MSLPKDRDMDTNMDVDKARDVDKDRDMDKIMDRGMDMHIKIANFIASKFRF